MNGRSITTDTGWRGDPADVVLAGDRAVALWFVRHIIGARPAWHAQGACKGSPLDFTSRSEGEISRCLQVCGGCPVMLTCRAWADEMQDGVAVLGGESGAARRARWALENKRGRARAAS